MEPACGGEKDTLAEYIAPADAPLTLIYQDNRTFNIVNQGDDYSQHASGHGTTGGVAQSNKGPAAAGGSAAASQGAAAATRGSVALTNRGLADRARGAPWWSKVLGVICLLAVIGAVLLVLLGGNGTLTLAGFGLAIVSGVAGVIPLFRG